jgi:hypothetical protein
MKKLTTGREITTRKSEAKKPFKLKDESFKGNGMLITDWDKIRELMYEGRGSGTNPRTH